MTAFDPKRTYAPSAPVAKVVASKGQIALMRKCRPHTSSPARQTAIPARIAALHKMTFNVATCLPLSRRNANIIIRGSYGRFSSIVKHLEPIPEVVESMESVVIL